MTAKEAALIMLGGGNGEPVYDRLEPAEDGVYTSSNTGYNCIDTRNVRLKYMLSHGTEFEPSLDDFIILPYVQVPASAKIAESVARRTVTVQLPILTKTDMQDCSLTVSSSAQRMGTSNSYYLVTRWEAAWGNISIEFKEWRNKADYDAYYLISAPCTLTTYYEKYVYMEDDVIVDKMVEFSVTKNEICTSTFQWYKYHAD
ncbi:MAG: hypothetical protein NC120_14220 [Ruminococcus sp.]|nr:hypothetical protein [Ruminococcus sp.]